ncbi:MAG: thermonuclease family protein [Geminicoccaceae bacterium]
MLALWFYRRRNLISGIAKVTSGNRLIVGNQKIRIYAMYGLYPSQPWYDQTGVEFNGGSISKTALTQKIDGRKVKCWHLPKEGSVFGGKVCRVYLDGEDVGEWMVRNGYAVADLSPVRRKIYIRIEKRAKKEKLALHQGTFDHPLIWLRNRFRNSDRVKEILSTKERYDLDDDDFDWIEFSKVAMRVGQAMTDGGGSTAVEVLEWLGDL